MNWSGVFGWIVDRLIEPSTYAGVAGLLTAAGFAGSGQTLSAAAAGIASTLAIVISESSNPS